MSEYPSEVVADIVSVLDWLKGNPGAHWCDMPLEISAQYTRWRDIIRGAPDLTDNLATFATVPGLSSFGELFILKHGPETEAPSKPANDCQTEPEWSEAKSPAEWRKILRLSETTMRRHRAKGDLVVDPITTKSWRIRIDSLERYTGNK